MVVVTHSRFIGFQTDEVSCFSVVTLLTNDTRSRLVFSASIERLRSSQSPKMEVIMQDNFNLASLAKLSKAELEALLATLSSQFNAASSEADRSTILSKIAMVRLSIDLK